jgi:hypothetical protein
LFRSDDRGDSWRKLSQTPSKDFFSLSFADKDHGWITSTWPAGMWATSDGGQTWGTVTIPANLQNPSARRDDIKRGWLYANDGTGADVAYRTEDAGKTWRSVPLTSAPTQEHERLLKQPGLISEPTGSSIKLLGVILESNASQRWGWTDRFIFHSQDSGASWFVVSDAPEPPVDQMILLNDARALVHSSNGKLFRSEGWFNHWRPTKEPVDQWEWSKRAHGATPLPSPVACLATAAEASVRVEANDQGCFHSEANRLALRWSRVLKPTVTVQIFGDKTENVREVSAEQKRSLISEILSIFDRNDGVPACMSTSNLGVTVTWQCGGHPEQKAAFTAPRCGGGHTGTVGGYTGKQDFMRAEALFDLAQKTAKQP